MQTVRVFQNSQFGSIRIIRGLINLLYQTSCGITMEVFKLNEVLRSFGYKGNSVRTLEKDGVVWWVLVDVCKVLGLSNSRVTASRLDSDEVSQTYVYVLGLDNLGHHKYNKGNPKGG